ncbi:hypothetical protein PVK06_004870 [Gossypium arboreum]|uniref:Putative plant transposon protein domain-containing protein n=1 Tax=Gossypium arboreum TaxID=29729 RepID=A0ABR0QT61_GOSAR|nr:hypothetical protein PVK06_004870 [Gossypium arboreum]
MINHMNSNFLQQVLDVVTNPGSQWIIRKYRSHSCQREYLKSVAKVWFYFVHYSFMPISHSSTISMERMLLLYAILTKNSINVGKIILKEIHHCAKKKAGSAYFPSLITSLCLRACVKTQENLKGRYVQGCISTYDLERLVERVHELNQGEQEEPTEPDTDAVEPEEEPVKLRVEPESASPMPTSASALKKSELSILMDMCKFMHNQQQTYWKYAKIRDD